MLIICKWEKNIAIGYGNFFDICNVYVLVLTEAKR